MGVGALCSVTLEELRQVFEGRGYQVRMHSYFSDRGMMVSMHSQLEVSIAGKAEVLTVIEAAVHVYRQNNSWLLRVTPHGGPHWVMCSSEDELETIVSDRLENPNQALDESWIAMP